MVRTIARTQKSAGHPYWLSNGTDLTNTLAMYLSGTNYILIDNTDALTSSLASEVTSAPIAYTVPSSGSDSLYDTPNRSVPVIEQITSTPFTISRSMIGINMGSDSSGFDHSKVGYIRLMDANTQWEHLELSAGSYDATAVARLDTLVNNAYNAGCDVIYCVHHVPTARSRYPTHGSPKAWLPGTAGTPGTIDYTSLTAFINYILNRYGNKIYAIEGWNEPGVTNSYQDSAGVSGIVNYNNTIAAAISTWNAANSGTVKMVSTTNTGWDGMATQTYCNNAIDAASGFVNCDVFGYHCYRGGGSTPFDVPINLIRPIKSWLAASSIPSKDLWITEFGDSTIAKAGASAAFWKRIMLLWFALGVKKLSPYSWNNTGIGNMQVSQVSSAFYEACDFLIGKQVTYVNAIHGGKLIGANVGGVDVLL